MLKKFLLNTFSSFVGTCIAVAVFALAAVLTVLAITTNLAPGTSVAKITDNSVLVIDLDGVIDEKETPVYPEVQELLLRQNLEKPKALNEIVASIRSAADNKQVRGIYLKCGEPLAGPATLNDIREALMEFRKTGKQVIAYGDQYSLGSYFVASAANKLILNPYGSVAIKGLGGSSFFFKGLLDKLGVQFQVVKVGTFKSAVEPYISTSMSEPAKAQLDTLYSTMWGYIGTQINATRKVITPVRLDSLVNDGITFASAERTRSCGLVDELCYERCVDDIVAKCVGVDKDNLNYIEPSALLKGKLSLGNYGDKTIAVVYATGEIIDGGNAGINYEKLVPVITELAENEDVAGMVLRVNSPGGSAFGSDQIGEALDYFQSKNKVLAVSMGDYAASGGYWISCRADRIFASPLTVTGSIGIFGLIPNFKGTSEKLGVNIESVSTNPEAQFPTGFEPMNAKQLQIMQNYVNRGYDRFVSRVAKGRHLTDAQVRKIAEGRVWNAIAAKNIGLVDELGTLRQAVRWVAKQSKLGDEYNVESYPHYEPSIWDVVPAFNFAEENSAAVPGEIKKLKGELIRTIFSRNKVWARMPEFRIQLAE